jgi:hypothetical protein
LQQPIGQGYQEPRGERRAVEKVVEGIDQVQTF